ncbi:MAG: SIMPL domain-containing protein, partial [Gemmatimonadota bacterium]
MNRLVAGLAIVASAACSSNAVPAAAQVVAGEGPPTLQVSGTATVMRAPDVAEVRLAVETTAETAKAASERNADRMEAVLEAILDQGVERDRVRTQRLELRPRYDRRREAETPTIVGYQAVNQVTVRLEDVARVGSVVDAAVRSGANRVEGIRFELADPEAAYHEALREAIAEARPEAEVAATALGLALGPPLHV